jgi:hypothetical protein
MTFKKKTPTSIAKRRGRPPLQKVPSGKPAATVFCAFCGNRCAQCKCDAAVGRKKARCEDDDSYNPKRARQRDDAAYAEADTEVDSVDTASGDAENKTDGLVPAKAAAKSTAAVADYQQRREQLAYEMILAGLEKNPTWLFTVDQSAVPAWEGTEYPLYGGRGNRPLVSWRRDVANSVISAVEKKFPNLCVTPCRAQASLGGQLAYMQLFVERVEPPPAPVAAPPAPVVTAAPVKPKQPVAPVAAPPAPVASTAPIAVASAPPVAVVEPRQSDDRYLRTLPKHTRHQHIVKVLSLLIDRNAVAGGACTFKIDSTYKGQSAITVTLEGSTGALPSGCVPSPSSKPSPQRNDLLRRATTGLELLEVVHSCNFEIAATRLGESTLFLTMTNIGAPKL